MVIKYQYCSRTIYWINASSDVCETTLFSTACHHCWHFRVVDWHPRGNPGTRRAAGNYEARLFIEQKDATIQYRFLLYAITSIDSKQGLWIQYRFLLYAITSIDSKQGLWYSPFVQSFIWPELAGSCLHSPWARSGKCARVFEWYRKIFEGS